MRLRLSAAVLFLAAAGFLRAGVPQPPEPADGARTDWPLFRPVVRPPVPGAPEGARNEIDAFLMAAQRERGLRFRPEAPREILLRRVYLDLTGLAPTPAERDAFLSDPAPDAYEKLVDRLLADPRHAERWARHWMDIWRYSDWAGWNDGGQIRDSQPHVWRWRDWIVESLHRDAGYDSMVVDMLAADERAPGDTSALRATGFLVRNYKMLSREQWLEDTVKHTAMAFMGLTVGCAKCHDHMTDPLPQTTYYSLRAIFEPHQVRIDHLPGEPDTAKDGLARVYDADPDAPTWFFPRGDEKRADRSRPIPPAVPEFLGGAMTPEPVALPAEEVRPQRRELVRQALLAAAEKELLTASQDLTARAARVRSLHKLFVVERLEDAGRHGTPEWEAAARDAARAQREEAVVTTFAAVRNTAAALRSRPEDAAARKAAADARAAFAAAIATDAQPLTTAYTPRQIPEYPAVSTGRRLAFARWLTRRDHPLTARVAVNHIWARHFGHGLVPTVTDFGPGGRGTLHPELLDWLAADFRENGWSMRRLHRKICLSAAYRQHSASGTLTDAERADPDNRFYWRFPARRLEAEAVRDNLLYVTGGLDLTRGGPEIDHNLALTSPRRSLYLRCAAEKQPVFLQVFDGPSVVECYERKPSVMPQQALALLNSSMALARAKAAAEETAQETDSAKVVRDAFVRFLSREPAADELAACLGFLTSAGARSRELLFLTLFNHHEFLTLR